VGGGLKNQEVKAMKCTACGSELRAVSTDLPFKVRETGIVILKCLPVLQCGNCPEYLLKDAVLARVDRILSGLGGNVELEIVRYAA
jgi:YgiT-type zinc finger domain-containing protein